MIKHDRYNELILQTLQNNARIANTELAEKIGLSPSACLRRVNELENSGLIAGYRAIFNRVLMGINFIAYLLFESKRFYKLKRLFLLRFDYQGIRLMNLEN